MNRHPFIYLIALATVVLACDVSSLTQQVTSNPTAAAVLATNVAPLAESTKESASTATATATTPPNQAIATSAPSPSAGVVSKTLIVNGDAEQGPGAPDDSKIVAVPGWTGTGKFTAVQYGASGGFAEATSPGPKDRGKNYFVGGPGGPNASAKQTVDVSAYGASIDGGNATYQLEGWLGGYADQNDYATVTAEFLGQAGKSLGKATLGPVKSAERKAETGSILKSDSGSVPKGTRTITITMQFVRVSGLYSDGSVDNVSLVLTTK
jgi:hypothetical protein